MEDLETVPSRGAGGLDLTGLYLCKTAISEELVLDTEFVSNRVVATTIV